MERQLTIKVIFDKTRADAPIRKTNTSLRAMTGSVENLQKRLQSAIAYQNKFTESTTRWASAGKVVERLQNQLGSRMTQTTRYMADNTRGSANMTMALQSMNFTIRDSPYFFRDFSLGILAIGNNLNPMIDSIIRVKKEMGGWKGAMRAFATQMMGPAGIIMAFSILVTVMQAIVFQMAKNKDEAEDLGKAYRKLKRDADDLKLSVENFTDIKVSGAQNPQAEAMIEPLQKQADAIARLIAMNARLKSLGETPAFDEAHIANLKKQYEDLNKQIQNIGNDGGKSIAKFTERMKGLIDSAEKGKQGIIDFAISNRIGDRQLQNASAEFKRYAEEYFAIDGKLRDASELPIDAPVFIKTGLATTKQELLDVSKLLDEIIGKGSKAERPLGLLGKLQEELKKAEGELPYATTLQQLIDLADRADKARDRIAELQTEIVLGQFNQTLDFEGLQGRVGVDIPKDEFITKEKKAKKPKLEIDDSYKEEFKMIEDMSNIVGKSMFDAFIMGKMGVDEMLKSLLAVVAQLVIIEGLKYVFSGGTLGFFSPFSQGGIVKASNGYVTPGYGSADSIPAMLRPNEMVLNPSQQTELYHMAKGLGNSGGSQRVDVVVSGEVTESKNKFHTRIKKAERFHADARGTRSLA